MIETCEPCAVCGEITPHSRRRVAPLRWSAAVLAALSALIVAGFLAGLLLEGRAAPGPGVWSLLVLAPAALALHQVDRARRWDLACTRCRARACAGRRIWRLPLRATTIDIG